MDFDLAVAMEKKSFLYPLPPTPLALQSDSSSYSTESVMNDSKWSMLTDYTAMIVVLYILLSVPLLWELHALYNP